jgi:hypothetical protein
VVSNGIVVGNVKLKKRSKLKTRRKGEEKPPSDEPTVPLVHSVGVVGTLHNRSIEADIVR